VEQYPAIVDDFSAGLTRQAYLVLEYGDMAHVYLQSGSRGVSFLFIYKIYVYADI